MKKIFLLFSALLFFSRENLSAQQASPELNLLPKKSYPPVIFQNDSTPKKILIADASKIHKTPNYHPAWMNAPLKPEIHWFALENIDNESYWGNVYSDKLLIEFKKGILLSDKQVNSFLKKFSLNNTIGKSMFPDLQNFYEFKLSSGGKKNIMKIIKAAKLKSFILYAEPSAIIKSEAFLPTDPLYYANANNPHGQWDMATIHVDSVWTYFQGGSTNWLSVIDNAVDYNHPDLYNTVWYGYDFANNDADPYPDVPADDHGTHVSGTVGATINNGIGIAGMTNDTIYFAKISDGNQLQDYAVVNALNSISGFNEVVVVNMSFRSKVSNQAIFTACANAWNNGKVLIAAAGNDTANYPVYPASYNNYVVSVSSVGVDNNGYLNDASYSNYGGDIDISAPGGEENTGWRIWSTLPNNTYGGSGWVGTSMAAPHVTGLAGIIAATNPFLNNIGIRSILEQEVIDLGTPGWDQFFGSGMICAWCAYEEACNELSGYLNLNVSGSTTFCQGGSVTLTATNNSKLTYRWKGNGAIINGATSNSYTITQSGSYVLEITTEGNCMAAFSPVVVTVNQLAAQPGTISGNTTVCQGTSQTYSVSSVSGATSYTWALPSGWSGSSTSNSITATVGSSGGTISVTANNGCGSSTPRTLAISVTALPSQPSAISGNTNPCAGSQSYSVTNAGVTYSWAVSGGGSIAGSGNSATVNWTSPGTWTITVTPSNSCGSGALRTLSVTVNPTPNAPTFSPLSGCNPVTVTATSANCNGCSYQWSTGSNNPTSIFTANSNYTVTATSSNNCSASNSGTITITGQPSVSIIPSVTSFCTGSTATLSTNPTGSSYAWSGPNGFTSSASQVTISVGGSYSVTVTNPGSCTGTASATTNINQYNAPNANAGVNQTNTGTGVSIGGNPTASGGTSPYTFSWNPVTGLNSSVIANPNANPILTTSYFLTVTDNNGCTASDNMVVTVQSNCTYNLSSQNVPIPASGGTYNDTLTTGTGCPWTISEGCNWLDFTNISGSGQASLTFNAQQNILSSQRTCVANIQGQFLTITQAGNICLAPVAGVSASQTSGFTPVTVNFFDNSSNSPTQWYWNFAGGNPSSSTVQNPANIIYANPGLFDVTLKVVNACDSNTKVMNGYINILGTGVNEIQPMKNIVIFPNPTNGTFTLKAELADKQNVKVNIFNSLSQIIYTKYLPENSTTIQTTFDLSGNAKGVYYLQLIAGGKYYYEKVVVE